jgi:hypothetical protein
MLEGGGAFDCFDDFVDYVGILNVLPGEIGKSG